MKAVVQNAYGSPDVLKIKEVDVPEIEESDVLVRVHAAAINAGDVFSVRGRPWLARFTVGFPKPNDYILGWDMAGRVEAVGENVTGFRPGDEVFATGHSSLAEHARVGVDALAPKPTNLTFEQAAAVPTAALTALQGLRDVGKIRSGHKVLINGASGGVGTFAVQIAKSFGAHVTGVCSTGKVELVRSLGADRVVDYTTTDFARGDERYDLILDNVASRAFSDLRRVLKPQGIIVPNSGHGGIGYVAKALVLSLFMRRQAGLFVAQANGQDLVFLKELIESGRIAPVIDRTYPLDATPEALAYLAEGHARGKVVITIVGDGI